MKSKRKEIPVPYACSFTDGSKKTSFLLWQIFLALVVLFKLFVEEAGVVSRVGLTKVLGSQGSLGTDANHFVHEGETREDIEIGRERDIHRQGEPIAVVFVTGIGLQGMLVDILRFLLETVKCVGDRSYSVMILNFGLVLWRIGDQSRLSKTYFKFVMDFWEFNRNFCHCIISINRKGIIQIIIKYLYFFANELHQMKRTDESEELNKFAFLISNVTAQNFE